ncbi:unnamed protein product [Closterium sp. NIES-65]|nr:unnamed protein product [Closterium sp. NIES-65]
MLRRPGVRKIIEVTVRRTPVNDGSSFELLLSWSSAGLRSYAREEGKRVKATLAHLHKAVAVLKQELMGDPGCGRRKVLLEEKEQQLKAYHAARRDRLHLQAGLTAELNGEIASKHHPAKVRARKARTQIAELNVGGTTVGGSRAASSSLLDEIKEAVTILLHKKGDKDQPNNYRPITLLKFTYKVLARVIADRMKAVLHQVISPEQYSFLPVSLVADIIEAARNGSKDWHLLLVDFQKGFDSVSRSFLFQVLRRMGFPDRSVCWIEGLHRDTNPRLLVNGWLGEGLEVVLGVRQGCPLAPYHFLYAVEPLTQEVERRRLGLSKEGQQLGYLSYADNMMLVLQGKQQIVRAVQLLSEFEKASGLAANADKTVVLPRGVNTCVNRGSLCGFKRAGADDAERLLGVWVTPSGNGLLTWEKALGHINGMSVKWKQKYLTTSARATVVNSYVTPIIAVQAQVYSPPAAIWEELMRVIQGFISGNRVSVGELPHPCNLLFFLSLPCLPSPYVVD